MATIRDFQVTFASWADFDRTLPPDRQGEAFAIIDPEGVRPRLFCLRVPEGSGCWSPTSTTSRAW